MSVIPTREQSPQIMRVTGALARPMGPQLNAPRPQGGMTGQDVLRIIRKRKWLIILSVVIALSVTCVVTFLWLKYAPQYTTVAHLRVQPSQSLLKDVRINRDMIKIHKFSLAGKITSRPVLKAAVENTELIGTKWYKKNREQAVRRLAQEIGVTPVRDTYAIRLSMKGTNKEELPIIVNAVASAFVDYIKNWTGGKHVAQADRLRSELKDQQNSLSQLEAEAGITPEADNLPGMQHRLALLTGEQQALTGEKIDLEVAIESTQEALGSLQQRRDKGEVFGIPAVQNAMSTDFEMRSMKNRLEEMHTEVGVLKNRVGPSHRTFLDLKQRIKDLEERISNYENILVHRIVQGMMGQHDEILKSSQSQRETIVRRLEQSQENVAKLHQALDKLTKKKARRQYLAREIDRISTRLTYMELMDIDEVTLDIPASIPDTIYMPKWSIMIPMGILLGLGFGVGIMFLIELIDTSIKSPTDIARRIDLPLLGMVPHTNDIDEEIEELHMACITHPNSLISEAFRNIRTCLLFSGPASQLRSILVTSPMPGDGRGTVALNLSASIAQSGRKVLVIDANFRQPMIHKTFPDCPEAGLSTALVGQADWKDIVKEVEPNLSVMASGPLPPNPAGLLGSDQMRNLLSEMETQYDQIIFDGPPCLLVTDAPVLGTMVDGVILVVRAGANTHGVVQRSRDMLQRVGAHVLGVVLNGIRVTAGGYLRKNYQSFYEYHEENLPLG